MKKTTPISHFTQKRKCNNHKKSQKCAERTDYKNLRNTLIKTVQCFLRRQGRNLSFQLDIFGWATLSFVIKLTTHFVFVMHFIFFLGDFIVLKILLF